MHGLGAVIGLLFRAQSRSARGAGLFDRLEESGEILRHGRPQDIEVDVEVVMHEPVAHAGGFCPRNLGVPLRLPQPPASLPHRRSRPASWVGVAEARRSGGLREIDTENSVALWAASIMCRTRTSSRAASYKDMAVARTSSRKNRLDPRRSGARSSGSREAGQARAPPGTGPDAGNLRDQARRMNMEIVEVAEAVIRAQPLLPARPERSASGADGFSA